MTDADLLLLLRCPVTHQPLRLATAEEQNLRGLTAGSTIYASADGSRLYGAEEGLLVLLSAKDVDAAG